MAKNGLKDFRKEILEHTPGCAYIVSRRGGIADEWYGGRSLVEPREITLGENTLFDLASLTKPLCTALIALKAYSLGLFDILEPAVEGGSYTPLDLLRHEAGFPSWLPLYRHGTKEKAREALLNEASLSAPGSQALYSCPGYILLGFTLEERLGEPLDALFDKLLKGPLGIEEDEALFNPPPLMKERTAGTELSGDFERGMAAKFGCEPPSPPPEGLWGTVHDGNSRFLGGVAGNAGLFATLRGAFKLASAFLPSSEFLPCETLSLVYNRGRAKTGEHRTAGFKLKGSPSWQTGDALKEGSIAHEGFTGTFAALTDKEEIMILLTNRIHPMHPGKPFSHERVSFLKGALELLG